MHVREQDNKIIITNSNFDCMTLSKADARKLLKELKTVLKTESKYKNEKAEYNGIEFDSKVERDFYMYLLQLHKSDDIIIQPKFVLQEKQKGLREIAYVADFQIGTLVYDVKGFQTPNSKLKVKMFKARYPDLCLSLVNKCPKKYQSIYGRWIDISVLNKLRSAAERAIKKAKDEVK